MTEKMSEEKLRNLIQETIKTVVSEQGEHLVKDAIKKDPSLVSGVGDVADVLSKSPQVTNKPQDQGKKAAGCVAALMQGGGDLTKAEAFANREFGKNSEITKALSASDFTAGGALLPEPVSMELIELLRPRSVVRRMDPQTFDLSDGGQLAVPRVSKDASANWISENEDIPKSEPEFGQVVLDLKKHAAMVPISNDHVRAARQDVLDLVRRMLLRTMGDDEDKTLLMSDGTGNEPVGLRHLAASANVTGSAGTSADNIQQDFKDLMAALTTNNVPIENPRFIMSRRSWLSLLNLRDTTSGELVFPEVRNRAMSEAGTVYGIPVEVSNNVPDNLGTGSDESVVMLAEGSELMLGQDGRLEVETSREASYTASGSKVSTFERDQSLVRVISRLDFKAMHEEAIAVKTGVKWS